MMGDVDCEKIRQLLSRFIDSQLDQAQRPEVEKHLAACKDCSEYYEHLLGLQKIAEGIEIGGDGAYWLRRKDAVMRRIEETESAGVTPVRARPKLVNVHKLIAVAASILLISLVSIFESQQLRPNWGLFKRKAAPTRAIQPEVEKPSVFYGTTDMDTAAQKKKDADVIDRARREVPPGDVSQEVVVAEKEKGVPPPDEFRPGAAAVEDEVIEESEYESATTKKMTAQPERPPETEIVVSPRPEKSEKASEIKRRGTEPAPEADERQRASDKVVVKEDMLDVAPIPESVEVMGIVQKSAGLDEAAATGTAAEVEGAPDLALFMNKRALTFDDELFSGYTEDQKAEYIKWRRKIDILQGKYGYLTSTHGQEMFAKAREPLPEDSLKIVVREMAVASYRLGKITPVEDELRAMLRNLQSLTELADSSAAAEIQDYITDLESLLK